jgi:hypothetical protein
MQTQALQMSIVLYISTILVFYWSFPHELNFKKVLKKLTIMCAWMDLWICYNKTK